MGVSRNTETILQHKRLVALYIERVVDNLFRRAIVHDDSKFEPEEFDLYEAALPRFEVVEYGSPEYFAVCQSIKPAIAHHTLVNRHHPEYFGEQGMSGMNLIDLQEMTCDWLAAAQRNGHSPENVYKGLEVNRARPAFNMGEQLYGIIKNTMDVLI